MLLSSAVLLGEMLTAGVTQSEVIGKGDNRVSPSSVPISSCALSTVARELPGGSGEVEWVFSSLKPACCKLLLFCANGRIPLSPALPPAETEHGCEWGCAPVGLCVWETAWMLLLVFELPVNNSQQASLIYRRKGLVCRRLPDCGSRVKINKVLLCLGQSSSL